MAKLPHNFTFRYILTILLSGHLVYALEIDRDLLQSLSSSPDNRADVLINFVGGNSQVIEAIRSKSFPDRVTKVKELCSSLQSLAKVMHQPVINLLGLFGIQSKSFWSSNQMVIKNAGGLAIQALSIFPQVSRVQRLPMITLDPLPSTAASTQSDPIQPNIALVQADKTWTNFGTRGEGVVVANIDTGVRGTHEALRSNFRSDHGWIDPYTNTTTPDDGNGHGTHTMGTICGQKGIGVAPGAQWIACRGCDSSNCGGDELLFCGQWMLSPTNPDGSDPDPTQIPNVVSCSWGSPLAGDPWYNPTIDAWDAAGISHAFANGNSGPACSTTGSPADQEFTFSVGSVDNTDKLSSFSSKGPVADSSGFPIRIRTKPDVCAPGSNVFSAWNTGDTIYNTISGTSMATPHVAGVMALVISAAQPLKLSPFQVESLLMSTTDTQNLSTTIASCGGKSFPNNEFGSGRVNAFNAVNKTVNEPPPTGSRENSKKSAKTKNCLSSPLLGLNLLCL